MLRKPFSVSLYAQSQQEEPQLFFKRFISNNAIWDNDFLKISQTQLGFSTELLNTNVRFEYQTINNPVYLNEFVVPEQHTATVSVMKVKLTNHLQIKGFGMNTTAIYQNISNTEIMPLPKYLLSTSIGYTVRLFKVLSLNPGIELRYVSAYYPEAYAPYLNHFYHQTQYQSSDHVFADVFLNFKVKRMMLFLKYQHINSGLMGYDYMMTPHYPMQDAAIKFGLKWTFFD